MKYIQLKPQDIIRSTDNMNSSTNHWQETLQDPNGSGWLKPSVFIGETVESVNNINSEIQLIYRRAVPSFWDKIRNFFHEILH